MSVCLPLTLISLLRHFVPSWRGHSLRERLAGHSWCPPHPQHRPAAPGGAALLLSPPQAAEEEGSAALLCPRRVVFFLKRASTTAKLLFFMSHLVFIVSQSMALELPLSSCWEGLLHPALHSCWNCPSTCMDNCLQQRGSSNLCSLGPGTAPREGLDQF